MRAVTIDSDLATLFTFTPRKPPITPIQGVEEKPCPSEKFSQYRNRDTARYLAIKCDKWRCCAMLAITRALHSTPQRRA